MVACVLLCIAGAVSPVKSEDRPRPLLKNVSLVAYKLFPGDRPHCAIDREALNTAIDFVANQSTKLKLIKEAEHYKRERELLDKSGEASRKYFAPNSTAADDAKKAWDEAREAHSKYFAAPKLILFAALDVLEHNGSCIGTVSATVTAMLKRSEMIATGTVILYPSEEIWSTSTLVAGPPSLFSRGVIETSETMMKSFVNDWTLSQE